MAKLSPIKEVMKQTGEGSTVGVLVAIAMAAAKPAVDMVIEQIRSYKEEHSTWVDIPDVYSKGNMYLLDKAEELLKAREFMTNPQVVTECAPRYRKCMDGQVVKTHPRRGKSVPPRSGVTIYYVTEDVISKSRILFDEAEKLKVERKEAINKKIGELGDGVKEKAVDIGGKAVKNITIRLQKKREKEPVGEPEE